MADISQVLTALTAEIAAIIYPNGEIAGKSILPTDAFIEVGWPQEQTIAATLASGNVTINVFPLDGERNLTKYIPVTETLPQQAPSLQAVLMFNKLVLNGSVAAGDVLGLQYNGQQYSFTPAASATLTAVAAQIATAVPGATSVGGTVALPTPVDTSKNYVKTAKNGTQFQTVKTASRRVQIIISAPTPELRDAVAIVLDPPLGALTFLPVDVGTGLPEQCKWTYVSSQWNDKAENASLYRRSLIYDVEYNTNVYTTAFAVLFANANLVASERS